ncbi:MAG TPA: TIGR02147 family protein [Bacteriovoracaceae bacterium]|nr:TIGR02147 family protein [Bacteriovoracaceae bacterium]
MELAITDSVTPEGEPSWVVEVALNFPFEWKMLAEPSAGPADRATITALAFSIVVVPPLMEIRHSHVNIKMNGVSIWNYESYKLFISDFIKSSPGKGRGKLKKMAEKLNVHPTLVSQVLSGQKDFSQEHALNVTKFLGLLEKEVEYFFELLFFAKASSNDLKNYHKKRITQLASQGQTVKSRLGEVSELTEDDKIRFYSDWRFVIVWLATSIKDLKHEASLSQNFDIPHEDILRIVDFLLEKNLCERADNGLRMKVNKIHVPSDSPLVMNHHINWRIKSLDFVRSVTPEELAFTAPFSVSKKDFAVIKSRLLDTIQEISKIVSESEPEVVACLNLDHFFVSRG